MHLLRTTGPQFGLVHTGHMDQGALASLTEAVRGWCQATQPPDPAITQLKFARAHKRPVRPSARPSALLLVAWYLGIWISTIEIV